jgi:hypothetical protein
VSVNAGMNQHPIDPNIYGTAFASTAQLSDLDVPLNRDGGNASDTYSYQQDATNHGSDWYFESIASGAGNGQGMDSFVSSTHGGGAQPNLTINLFNWAAKHANSSTLGSFSVAKYGAQQSADPFNSDLGNGVHSNGTNVTGNDPNDAYVANSPSFEQTWIQHLISSFGDSQHGGVQYYTMGNEPALWNSTHRDIHPNGETNTELFNEIVAYASMIKLLDPHAKIVGPEEWGWTGYFIDGADAANHNWGATYNGLNVQQWLLQQLQQHDASTGQRLLDYFTLHYYPQGDSAGHQEFSNNVDDATELLRNRSTRSLWDPNYVDQSWIGGTGINGGKVNLINMMRSWVNTYYPGTKIGVTEYNWGAEGHMSGATTQADIWGIFGREGLDLANRWTTPSTGSPTYLAMKMYRNYDGNKSTFGDVSVSATVPNPDQVSAFASLRSSDGALTIMIVNKNLISSGASTSITVDLSNFANLGVAQEWQLAAVNPSDLTNTSITHPGNITVSGNSFAFTSPNQSVELFVLAPVPKGKLFATGAGPGGGPHVKVFDPLTGATKFSFLAYGSNFTGGVRVATGDVNGDGVDDIITAPGPGGGPDIRVYDGVTGNKILEFMAYSPSFTGGVFVAAADVNGDHKADIITGAGPGGGPHVKVFDGANPSNVLASFFAYGSSFKGGVEVAAADVNGDGKADVITGAGPGGGPHVKVFNGANLSNTLSSFMAFDTSYTGGLFVAAGDLDGDGKADIIAGQATGANAHVRTFRGSDGTMTGDIVPFGGTGSPNGVTVAVEDRDGDGLGDVIVGSGPGSMPSVRTFKGTNLSQLSEFNAYDPSFLGGVFVG